MLLVFFSSFLLCDVEFAIFWFFFFWSLCPSFLIKSLSSKPHYLMTDPGNGTRTGLQTSKIFSCNQLYTRLKGYFFSYAKLWKCLDLGQKIIYFGNICLVFLPSGQHSRPPQYGTNLDFQHDCPLFCSWTLWSIHMTTLSTHAYTVWLPPLCSCHVLFLEKPEVYL